MRFEFLNQRDEIVATGQQTGIFIGFSDQRIHKLSDSERALFEPYCQN